MNCIIIDDEPTARDIVELFCNDCPNLNVKASYSSALEALEFTEWNEIDLLFLDINMPRLSGLQFLKTLTNPPLVVFTTAYPEYAVEGFDVNAVDFLLKPFSFARFLKAVSKAQQQLTLPEQNSIKGEKDYILLKSNKKLYRVPFKEIQHIESMGDYVQVVFQNKQILVHDTFSHLLSLLPKSTVVRVHKSFAVGTHFVDVIEGNTIRMGSKQIPIGQKYKDEFFDELKH